MGATKEPSGSDGRVIGSGRAGPIRKALNAALEEARESGRMTLEHEVRAVVAQRVAAVCDLASKSGDARGVLAAGDKLIELLDTLPVRDVGGGGSDGPGDKRAQLHAIMRGGPEVGDEANP